MQNVSIFTMPAGQPGSPASSARHAFGCGCWFGSHEIASANRGVQHSMPADPAQVPPVGVRVSMHSLVSMQLPGRLLAVQLGAALAGCASGVTGTVQLAPSTPPSHLL